MRGEQRDGIPPCRVIATNRAIFCRVVKVEIASRLSVLTNITAESAIPSSGANTRPFNRANWTIRKQSLTPGSLPNQGKLGLVACLA